MSLYVRDPLIGKLINIIMYDGKKSLAEKIVDKSMWILRRKYNVEDPLSYIKKSIDQGKPVVDLKKYRIGGKAVRIPAPCREGRQQSLALRFIRYAFLEKGCLDEGDGWRGCGGDGMY